MLAAVLVYLGAAMANGLFLGLAHDEGVSVDIAVGSLDPEPYGPIPIRELYSAIDGTRPRTAREVVRELSGRFKNPSPPGYYLLLNGWTELVGTHRVALRIPSLVFGLATLLGLARLGRRLVPSPLVGLWIILLAALSPWFVTIMTFARPYAMIMAVGIWSTLAALAMADAPRRVRPRVLFVVLSLVGLYSLYHYGFVLLWQAIFLGVVALRSPEGRARQLVSLAVVFVVIAGGFAPWIPTLMGHLQLTGDVPSYFHGPVLSDAAARASQLLLSFFLGEGLGGVGGRLHWLALTALGLITLFLLFRFRRQRDQSMDDPVAALLMRTAPIYPALILVGDLLHGTRTLIISKTSFLLFPFLLLLVLRVWLSLPHARARLTGLVVLASLLASAMVSTIVNNQRWVDDHSAVAETLVVADDAHHRVLVNSLIRGHSIPLLLTLKERGVKNVEVVYAPPDQMLNILGGASADPETAQLTMINLHAVYAWDESSQLWSPDQLQAAARQARRSGWAVHRSTPAAILLGRPPASGERRLRIIAPVR